MCYSAMIPGCRFMDNFTELPADGHDSDTGTIVIVESGLIDAVPSAFMLIQHNSADNFCICAFEGKVTRPVKKRYEAGSDFLATWFSLPSVVDTRPTIDSRQWHWHVQDVIGHAHTMRSRSTGGGSEMTPTYAILSPL